ncbi:MAG: gamma-glutamyltransferase [Bacteroidetes bacterium]|nr:gamma-glutamyltransferase [Bacteroidota bacterium]
MKIFKLTFLLLFLFNGCFAQTDSKVSSGSVNSEGFRNGIVSSADELASQVGIEILKKGGNAVDAAVAVGFTLAVVYPGAGNIGGGGFMLIHLKDGKNISIDYREKAPIGAFKDMYLDSNGNVVNGLSTTGPLAGGVPGSVAGMLYALEKYGTMSRQEVMQYAIDYAENGFKIHKRLAENINSQQKEFQKFPSTMEIFGGKFKEGDLLVQKDLAKTLRRISEQGRDGFYNGETAEYISEEMRTGYGIVTKTDLEAYDVKERTPLVGNYRGYEVISMPPPSSGGICLLYLLNILENYDLKSLGFHSPETVNLMTEAMRRVYADRSKYMGDPDFVEVPVDVLVSKNYAKERMKNYEPGKAGNSKDVQPGEITKKEKTETTHYCVVDKDGNLVSTTTTLNDNFGSKLIIKGAGFFWNDEMDDFSSKPGAPNMYGLVGSEANSIAPQKRMLSSMTPTIILKDNKPFMVVGSPGGGRIITSVLQTIVNVIEFNMSLSDAVDSPRFHHQWLPDEIQIEKGVFDNSTEKALKNMGYGLKEIPQFGRVEAILFKEDGSFIGHSDRRGYGKAIGY